MQTKYYETVQEMSNDIRLFRHDFKNHMNCVRGFIADNKPSFALEYLDSIVDNSPATNDIFNSGNPIADIILNEKYQLARKNSCHFSFNGAISPNISAFNICTILANTLDNSIEACAKIKTENDRFVAIDCVVNNNIQIITVTNSIESINHTLKTTKNNPSEHGIGLYSIRRTVESLNGTLEISQSDNTFILDIMINIPSAI